MSQENRKPKLFVPGRKKGPIDLPAETHLFFSHFQVGKVNHCSLHSRSAKFRGLMYQVKYGAVIGLKQPSLEIVTGHIQSYAFLGQSQRRI
jgi:ribosomal protein L30/L7E